VHDLETKSHHLKRNRWIRIGISDSYFDSAVKQVVFDRFESEIATFIFKVFANLRLTHQISTRGNMHIVIKGLTQLHTFTFANNLQKASSCNHWHSNNHRTVSCSNYWILACQIRNVCYWNRKQLQNLHVLCLNKLLLKNLDYTLPETITIVKITERIMMIKVVETAQFTLFFVGNGPHGLKILWTPRWHYTNSLTRKCKFAYVSRRSAGLSSARGPIGSNRSNRRKIGPSSSTYTGEWSPSKIFENSFETRNWTCKFYQGTGSSFQSAL